MTSAQLFYAFTLGMLAAVNPCGFPLLPAYLELFTGAPGDGRPLGRVSRAVAAGALSTVGFLLLFAAFGVIVEAGWSTLAGHAVSLARYVMVGLGLAMVAVGLAAVAHRPLRVRLPSLPSGRGRRRPVAIVVFGFSYGVASLGCALPLFVSGVATTFTGGGAFSGVAVFVAYALGMGAVLSALAAAVALVGPAAGRPLRRFSRLVPTLGGALLAAVGAYLAWYWISAIAAPTASNPVERVVEAAQRHVAAFIQADAGIVGAVAGTLVVIGVFALALAEPRSTTPGAGGAHPDQAADTPRYTEATP